MERNIMKNCTHSTRSVSGRLICAGAFRIIPLIYAYKENSLHYATVVYDSLGIKDIRR